MADDSPLTQWTNDSGVLILCSDLDPLMFCNTLEKAVITMAPTTLEFLLLREMHFHLKGFILLS